MYFYGEFCVIVDSSLKRVSIELENAPGLAHLRFEVQMALGDQLLGGEDGCMGERGKWG